MKIRPGVAKLFDADKQTNRRLNSHDEAKSRFSKIFRTLLQSGYIQNYAFSRYACCLWTHPQTWRQPTPRPQLVLLMINYLTDFSVINNVTYNGGLIGV